MKEIFRPRGYITVPDGTDVSPFLNASDTTQDSLPWGLLGEMSIASGRIRAGVHSHVHVHPVVTQVTYVAEGRLTIRMKDPTESEPYDLHVKKGEAVVCRSGTLFQLRNDSAEVAEVLYIASPSYVFELEEGQPPRYDDAVMLAETWEELANANYAVEAPSITDHEPHATRAESMRRLAVKKGIVHQPIAEQDVVPLKSDYDYLAPDGSEIRLLVDGDNGGLAHCVLPAGATTKEVRHRTVEELWYVLDGEGEIRRQQNDEPPKTDPVGPGDSVRIPVDTKFRFSASRAGDLKLLLATMPPWPGPKEAVPTVT